MIDLGGRRKTDVGACCTAVRILAVDDDKAYLNYLKLVLTRAGFDVVTASEGEAAVRRVREDEQIRVLLIDLSMPRMNGIDIIHRLQETVDSAALYMILLTGHSGQETKIEAFANGFDDFLAKSESEEEIVAKLRSAARRMEMERQLHIENEQLHALAFTDELTGTGNRRALLRASEELIAAKHPFTTVLFDLDRFKEINDTHGHTMGDQVLVAVAGCLKAKTRVGDVITRFGGDEFVVLLAGVGEKEAASIAGRIAQSVALLEWHTDRDVVRVSVSFGFSAGDATLREALDHCDAKMYAQKRGARSGSGSRTSERARQLNG